MHFGKYMANSIAYFTDYKLNTEGEKLWGDVHAFSHLETQLVAYLPTFP